MLRAVGILLMCLGLYGCEKDGATVDPDLAPMQLSTPLADDPLADAAPDGSDAQYGAEEVGAADEAAPGEGAAEPEATSDGPLTGHEALALAESAASGEVSAPSFIVSPAIPPSWPPSGDEVVFFVYPLEPTKSDVTKYTCGAPVLGVHLNFKTRETRIEKLPAGKTLGTLTLDREITTDDPLHRAQEALFEVASGKVTPEKRKYLLVRYGAWFAAHPALAKDLSKRAPDFVEFVTP